MKICLGLAFAVAYFISAGQRVDTIHVTKEFGVYVVFDSEIKKVDIASKLEYGFNVDADMLMLRAIREDAKNTSIMVRTLSDDYVFILSYRQRVKQLLIRKGKQYDPQLAVQPPVGKPLSSPPGIRNVEPGSSHDKSVQSERFSGPKIPKDIQDRIARGNRDVKVQDSTMEKKLYSVYEAKKTFRDLGEISNGLFFSLHNVYVDTKHIYIKLSLHNTSSISFDIDFVYFERVQGKNFKKREAFVNTATPYVFKESVYSVAPASDEVMVFVLNLFAYKEKDNLLVRVNEKGGLRSLQFSIPCKEIVNATSL